MGPRRGPILKQMLPSQTFQCLLDWLAWLIGLRPIANQASQIQLALLQSSAARYAIKPDKTHIELRSSSIEFYLIISWAIFDRHTK